MFSGLSSRRIGRWAGRRTSLDAVVKRTWPWDTWILLDCPFRAVITSCFALFSDPGDLGRICSAVSIAVICQKVKRSGRFWPTRKAVPEFVHTRRQGCARVAALQIEPRIARHAQLFSVLRARLTGRALAICARALVRETARIGIMVTAATAAAANRAVDQAVRATVCSSTWARADVCGARVAVRMKPRIATRALRSIVRWASRPRRSRAARAGTLVQSATIRAIGVESSVARDADLRVVRGAAGTVGGNAISAGAQILHAGVTRKVEPIVTAGALCAIVAGAIGARSCRAARASALVNSAPAFPIRVKATIAAYTRLHVV